jgi:hypothetical protein
MDDLEKRKFLTLPRTSAVQPVGSRNTDFHYTQNCTFVNRPKFWEGSGKLRFIYGGSESQNLKTVGLRVSYIASLACRSCAGNCEESRVKFAGSLWWILCSTRGNNSYTSRHIPTQVMLSRMPFMINSFTSVSHLLSGLYSASIATRHKCDGKNPSIRPG